MLEAVNQIAQSSMLMRVAPKLKLIADFIAVNRIQGGMNAGFRSIRAGIINDEALPAPVSVLVGNGLDASSNPWAGIAGGDNDAEIHSLLCLPCIVGKFVVIVLRIHRLLSE